jgi:curved DNA-binding protein CbpA
MGSGSDDKDRDLYTLLGLSRSASDDEIRNAYYELAKAHHPDKQDKKSEEAFRVIARAAAILRDPEKRRLYDRGDISLATNLVDLREVPRRNSYGRLALVFLAVLTVTSVVATGLSVIVLRRAFEPSKLTTYEPGQGGTSKVAEAAVPRDEYERGSVHPPNSVPSDVSLDSRPEKERPPGQLPRPSSESAHEPQPSQPIEAPVSSRASGRVADSGQILSERTTPSFPQGEPFKNGDEPPLQKTGVFGLPDFDISAGNGRLSPAKLSLVREAKAKRGDCSLTLAAKDILLHVSAALSAK